MYYTLIFQKQTMSAGNVDGVSEKKRVGREERKGIK